MSNSNTARDKILEQTEQGFLLFLKFFPSLIVQKKYGIPVQLESPFRHRPGKLSVYFNDDKGKWFFSMGKELKVYGDIFGFIANLYKLDFKRDFQKIIRILQQEMAEFDHTSLGQTERIAVNQGEWLEMELANDAGKSYEQYFAKVTDVSFAVKALARFKSKQHKQVEQSNEMNNYFAVEAIPKRLYYVFDTERFSCTVMGEKPDNFYFGLEQAIKINFFLSPTSKPNLILCNKAIDVLILNYVGIPAIQVDYDSLLENAYFRHIVHPTFPNLIATGNSLPKEIKKKYKIKVFDVQKYLSAFALDFRNHCLVEHDSEDFLEPLWELYSYIDDDHLIN